MTHTFPAPPRLTRPKLKRAFLHIGTTKTGTSSIQQRLFRNRDNLRGAGILYPANEANHVFFASAFRLDPTEISNNLREGLGQPTLLARHIEREFEKLTAEIDAFTGDTFVISSEFLSDTPPEGCMAMAAWLKAVAEEVTIVCYIRHPVFHAISSAQQVIRAGLRTLEQTEQELYFYSPSNSLPRFIDAFGRPHMLVRPFEREALKDGDVVTDFLGVVGEEAAILTNDAPAEANPAMSLEAALIADALMQKEAYRQDGDWNPNRARSHGFNHIPGTPFSFSKAAYKRLTQQAAPDVRYLKKVFGVTYRKLPPKSIKDPKPAWGPETIEGLAEHINKLALESQHARAKVFFLNAREAMRNGNRQKALFGVQRALVLKPEFPQAAMLLCRLLRAQGRLDEAITQARRQIELRPDFEPMRVLLARLEANEDEDAG
ncbi:tetratricopeptide repeat protein [Pseudokordiimonas caeni]|uniref:tetratricopeptide repeat protein n=1 Tax=Pseudokordiimonas caeni TaxID=2997908 RepID=UPI002811D0D2|nr:tetratricopeptide repeat protein [Pseudokordiimonas caeni]